jgi:hypothetical protein
MATYSNPYAHSARIDLMDAEHCRFMTAMGKYTLARLGWTDADIREMARRAA